MSSALPNSQNVLSAFRDLEASQHLSADALSICRGLFELAGGISASLTTLGEFITESMTPLPPDGGQARVETITATGLGILPPGAIFVRFQNAGTGTAGVGHASSGSFTDVVSVPPGGVMVFPTAYGQTLPAFTYSGTSTVLLISATYPPA